MTANLVQLYHVPYHTYPTQLKMKHSRKTQALLNVSQTTNLSCQVFLYNNNNKKKKNEKETVLQQRKIDCRLCDEYNS